MRDRGERILLSFFRLGFFDEWDASAFPFKNDTGSVAWSALDSPAHRAMAREAAAKSTVLIKNNKKKKQDQESSRGAGAGFLPLDASTVKSIAVIGPFAACVATSPKEKNGTCYLHSYNGNPSSISSIVDGIRTVSAASAAASASASAPASASASAFTASAASTAGNAGVNAGADVPADAHAQAPTVTYALGSNATCGWKCGAPHSKQTDCFSDPHSPGALAIAEAVEAAKAAEVVVLALGLGATMEGEGCDRFDMTLSPVQQALHKAVSAVSDGKLVLVLVSAGGVDADEDSAEAVVWAPYGGEEAGTG